MVPLVRLVNVGKMAGIVHVLRLGLPHAVTEIINAYDTPDMIRHLPDVEIHPDIQRFTWLLFLTGIIQHPVELMINGLPHAVTEIINAYDTPDMIRIIKERFWLYADGDYVKSSLPELLNICFAGVV
jgi:hypothetical protein